MTRISCALLLALLAGWSLPLSAQSSGEATHGEGPFSQLVLRAVTVIDGTGAPAFGPADVVIRQHRIEAVVPLGPPGAPVEAARRPALEPGGREVDGAGMYLLPGFIDLYGHLGSRPEYERKLWLGHGITTVREPLCRQGAAACRRLEDEVAANRQASPRYVHYVAFGIGARAPLSTPEAARGWVAEVAAQGAAGIKLRGQPPEVLEAALAEAKARGIGSSVHLDASQVARADALNAARWGAGMIEHGYGLAEALLPPGAVQSFPPDYNHSDQQHRFAAAGRLWLESAPPGSPPWERALDALTASGVTLVPTLSLYEALRGRAAVAGAEWHAAYTRPSLWHSFEPAPGRYATPWARWTSEDEAVWSAAYVRWMRFLLEFKDRGGRVAAGSDSGFLYNLHGFGFVRELELLREAGFTPLEVVRAATLEGARALGWQDRLGSVEVGKVADLVLLEENPLADLKVLYATGALRLDSAGKPVRVGGVRYTLKDGILYDARALLADVRKLVAEEWQQEGKELAPPGTSPDTLRPASQRPAGGSPQTRASDSSRSDGKGLRRSPSPDRSRDPRMVP